MSTENRRKNMEATNMEDRRPTRRQVRLNMRFPAGLVAYMREAANAEDRDLTNWLEEAARARLEAGGFIKGPVLKKAG